MPSVVARLPRLMKLGPPLRLVGHRCTPCGRVAFPPDPYGCEQCGAEFEELEPMEFAPVGRVQAFATVHRHHHDRPETPFTVATVLLDGGPVLKAVLVGDLDGLSVGDGVVGVAEVVGTGDAGADLVDLRFQRQVP